MYQHPLERLLIYTDKKFLDDFDLSQTEFCELYELFITTKNELLDPDISAVMFFNEVFYYLTTIYDDLDAAEHLTQYYKADTALYPPIEKYIHPKNDVDRTHAYEYTKEAEGAKFYIMDFVWFILNKQQELPQHVVFFKKALNKQFEKDETEMADEFRAFMQSHPEQYNISFIPHPEFDFSFIIGRSTQEWQEATCDFDRIEILKIVQRFPREDQPSIISSIQEAYNVRRGSGIERQISAVTQMKRASDAFFENLAKEENLDALNSAKVSCETQPQDTVIHEGFEAYIIKDHKKVMDILLLVANMGKSQLALFIKFVKAFQKLGYIRTDCFDDIQRFKADTTNRFSLTIDLANLKKYIAEGNRVSEQEYRETVDSIATYLQPLL